VPTPAGFRKQFIKAFASLAHHRERHDVLADFLEMAVCAIRKTTLPPGPAADAIEDQYMAVVKRNKPEDVRAMPELLGITTLAIQEGGCDFLGQVIVDLELRNDHMGQFFTPYDVSRMMAEMILGDAGEVMKERGFITLMEPASGAGGMIIAAADVIEKQGFDIGQKLYVDATDLSPMCFKMTYLQTSLRGIPATIRRGNTLSLEMFDHAVTPAFLPFLMTHGEAFAAWQKEAPATPVQPVKPHVKQPRPISKTGAAGAQLNLFDPP
jgi:hypothetical protein